MPGSIWCRRSMILGALRSLQCEISVWPPASIRAVSASRQPQRGKDCFGYNWTSSTSWCGRVVREVVLGKPDGEVARRVGVAERSSAADVAKSGRSRAGPAVGSKSVAERAAHTHAVDLVELVALQLGRPADGVWREDAHAVELAAGGEHRIVPRQRAGIHQPTGTWNCRLLDLATIEVAGDLASGRLANHARVVLRRWRWPVLKHRRARQSFVGHAQVDVQAQGLSELLLEELADVATVDAADNLSDDVAVVQRRVCSPLAGLEHGCQVGDATTHAVPIAEPVGRVADRRLGHAAALRHGLAHGHPVLAVRAKLRPVAADRPIVVELALVRQNGG